MSSDNLRRAYAYASSPSPRTWPRMEIVLGHENGPRYVLAFATASDRDNVRAAMATWPGLHSYRYLDLDLAPAPGAGSCDCGVSAACPDPAAVLIISKATGDSLRACQEHAGELVVKDPSDIELKILDSDSRDD